MGSPSRVLNVLLRIRYRRLTGKYRRRFGAPPEHVTPARYSEKIHWRKLFDRNPLFPIFLDKIAVRSYVRKTTGDLKFPRILWLGSDPESIPYQSLPEQYVIKPNCRSGARHFVISPADVDKDEIAAKCRQWLRAPYGQKVGEWGYRHIKRALMIEEMLDMRLEEGRVRDFRFHVYDGRVHLITTDVSDVQGSTRVPLGLHTFHDRDWRQLPYIKPNRQSRVPPPMPRPPQLDRMLAAAEALGCGVDYLRVDLYLVDGEPYFGELTVYPLSGLEVIRVAHGTGLDPVEDYEIHMSRPWRLPEIPLYRKLYRGLLG